MNLSDLIIIYLACGSPFGVYQITKRQQQPSPGSWASILTSFLLWPVLAITLLVDRIVSDRDNTDATANARIERIRSDIERIAFSGGATAALFEFREVFYRFTGLFAAANTEITKRPSSELFEVSGHSNKELASRCMARRNREKLAYHQVLARNEFVDLIADLANGQAGSIEVAKLALELADHLGDADTSADLSAVLSGQVRSSHTRTSDLEKEVWKSQTPSISTTN